MSKKQYRLITPVNASHSLEEAGSNVTTRVMTESQVMAWLNGWSENEAPEFFLEESAFNTSYKVRVVTQDDDTAEFTQSYNELQAWLRNYGSMDPRFRAPQVKITRISS